MAEKQNRKTRRTLAAVKKKYVEALDLVETDGAIMVPFEAYGEVWEFPHPMFADPEWSQAVDQADTNEAKGAAILGEDQYERFIKAGGSIADLLLIFMDVARTTQDELPTGGPTRP
ncbi:MAG TPA: hypothetical protein VKZ82_28480 [Nonomuraea sp.]|nr:hypothetical protein [Nonomuraea sp.]